MNAVSSTDRPRLPDIHPGAYEIIAAQALLLQRVPLTRQEYEDASAGMRNLTNYIAGLESERNRLAAQLEAERNQKPAETAKIAK